LKHLNWQGQLSGYREIIVPPLGGSTMQYAHWLMVAEMVERAMEGRDDKQEKAMFAVFETAKRLKQFKANYYAAWHGEKERQS
jgi:hypothetical protein